jgi:hypothetical protein
VKIEVRPAGELREPAHEPDRATNGQELRARSVHPEGDMRRLVEEAGFELVSHAHNMTWSADVFMRRASTATAPPA